MDSSAHGEDGSVVVPVQLLEEISDPPNLDFFFVVRSFVVSDFKAPATDVLGRPAFGTDAGGKDSHPDSRP